jgi:hypothetical protein
VIFSFILDEKKLNLNVDLGEVKEKFKNELSKLKEKQEKMLNEQRDLLLSSGISEDMIKTILKSLKDTFAGQLQKLISSQEETIQNLTAPLNDKNINNFKTLEELENKFQKETQALQAAQKLIFEEKDKELFSKNKMSTSQKSVAFSELLQFFEKEKNDLKTQQESERKTFLNAKNSNNIEERLQDIHSAEKEKLIQNQKERFKKTKEEIFKRNDLSSSAKIEKLNQLNDVFLKELEELSLKHKVENVDVNNKVNQDEKLNENGEKSN